MSRSGATLVEWVVAVTLLALCAPALLPPVGLQARALGALHAREAARCLLEGELALARSAALESGEEVRDVTGYRSAAQLRGLVVERVVERGSEGWEVTLTARWEGRGGASQEVVLEGWVAP